MTLIPSWFKDLVQVEKVASKEEPKKVKLNNKEVEAKFNDAIKAASTQIDAYDSLIGEVGDVSIESKLLDAKKQLVAFTTDLLSIKGSFIKEAHSQHFVNASTLIEEAVYNEKISRFMLKKKDINAIKKVIGACGGNDIIKAALESYLTAHPIKVGVRQQTEKENLFKEEIYQVADPTAAGNGTNAITLEEIAEVETVDNEAISEYTILLYWTESGVKLFEDTFESEEKADEIFNNLKLKLANVAKLEAEGKHAEGVEAMKALQKTFESISAPLVEDMPPITTTNAELKKEAKQMSINQAIKFLESNAKSQFHSINKIPVDSEYISIDEEGESGTWSASGLIEEAEDLKKQMDKLGKDASLTKSGMLIDQVTLKNKKELLAYSGGKDGDYLWQKGEEIVYGSYKGAIDYITDAVFTPMKSIKFKSEGEARTKAEELANTESLRDTVNRGLGGIQFNEIETVKEKKEKEPTVETPSKPEEHLEMVPPVIKKEPPVKTILEQKLEDEEKAKAKSPEALPPISPIEPKEKVVPEIAEGIKEAPAASPDEIFSEIEKEVK